MTKDELRELREMLDDDGTSEDALNEWCLERGGWQEVVACLVDMIPGGDE